MREELLYSSSIFKYTMMEASSPLAAMQAPSAFMGGHGFRDAAPTYASYAAARNLGPNSFNFRDLSMKRSQSDYFSMNPMRGSSPTASLAADLSQNFHIDQSPQLPTPRRALFSNNLFVGNGRVGLTTPPVPSSSPGPTSDSMDISPLPHKAPYGSCIELRLQSPTPELTPADSSMLSMPSPPLSDSMTDAPVLTLPTERRKSGPLRPLLGRTKGFSTNSITLKPSQEAQLPPFRFGSTLPKPTASSSLSLSEAFAESPSQERSLPRPGSLMGPPRAKQPFSLGNATRTGSPVGGHVRKSSNPLVRPRKQFRRSLSMYEHPEDVMNQERAATVSPPLPSIMDVEVANVPQLPHFVSPDQAGDLPRITKQTLCEVLDGKYNTVYEKLVIVDARFEYEYNGGHINGAVNFNDKEQLAAQLFNVEPSQRALLIFHCEYSAHRAPIMAKFIRNRDRKVNEERYPNLTYPETYILDGGYSSFFRDHRMRCFPQNYVEMDAKEHAHACEKALGKVKQRSKLIRAQTFAFGQQSSPNMNSSPTAQGRIRADTDVDMDMGLGSAMFKVPSLPRPFFDSKPIQARRMLSY